MKRSFKNCVLLLFAFLLSVHPSHAQQIFYTSVQGKQVDGGYTGSYSKSTDNYEHGTTTLTKSGPIVYSVTPAGLTIGTNESKTWNGTVTADPDNIPAAGTTVPAKLSANYTIGYSRPKGAGGGGAVISTHECGGCAYHGEGNKGEHEVVEKNGTDSLTFSVVSIQLNIEGKDSVCEGDTVIFTATEYPGGGTTTWFDGSTGTTCRWVADASRDITATYAVGGVTYTDTRPITVKDPGNWARGVGVPSFEGWTHQINKVEEIKNKTKNALYAIPAEVVVTGPEVSFSYGVVDCCNEGTMIDDGQSEVEGTITAGLTANVPMASPPWTAQINIVKQKYGYIFLLKLKYGLFLNAGINFTGSLGYRADECVPEDCFTGSIGLDCPLTLSLTASGEASITRAGARAKPCKGTNVGGSHCGRTTTNWCGYCSEYNGPGVPVHTSQSWWCLPNPSFNVTPASLSTSFYGKVTYNADSCSSGWDFGVGIGPVTFTASVSLLDYELSWSYPIWAGCQIYP